MKYFSVQAQSGDRLYLTEIQAEVEGDAWFPEYEKKGWKEVSRDRRKTK